MKHTFRTILESLVAGDFNTANTLTNSVLEEKAGEMLIEAVDIVAESMYATTEGDDISEDDFITDEEYEALSDEEKAEWEAVEIELEEGVEPVTELSKGTLGSYLKKAKDSASGHVTASMKSGNDMLKHDKKALKRYRGMSKAVANLHKEEADTLEEGNAENKAKKNAAIASTVKNPVIHTSKLQAGRAAAKAGKDSDLKTNKKKAVYKHIIKKIMKKEGVEQLDELSKKTLVSYVKKASTSAFRHKAKADSEDDKAASTDGMKYPEKQKKHNAKAAFHKDKEIKRNKGISQAKSKLPSRTKASLRHKTGTYGEGVEPVTELSNKTLKGYIRKAASDAFSAGHDSGKAPLGTKKSMKSYEKGSKRLSGIRKATDKLAKEGVEPVEEVSKKTIASYIGKAAHSVSKLTSKGNDSVERSIIAKKHGKDEESDAHHSDAKKAFTKLTKRQSKIGDAAQRLAKESTEPVEEKILDKIKSAGMVPNSKTDDKPKTKKTSLLAKLAKHGSKAINRGKVWEDVERVDELSGKTTMSYIRKSIKAGKKHRATADREEDKAVATNANKYPDKQKKHNDAVVTNRAKERKRGRGLQRAIISQTRKINKAAANEGTE